MQSHRRKLPEIVQGGIMTKKLVAGSATVLDTGCWVLLAAVLMSTSLSALMLTPGMGISIALAQMPIPPQLGVLPEGEITAVGSATLDVAGTMYALHPKLTIVSDTGRPMEWKELRVGLVIQYHVKEGALDRIIVLIPR